MRRVLLLVGLLAPLVPAPSSVLAAGTAVVAGPGSAKAAAYATPVAVVQVDDQPVLANTDINWHSLAAVQTGPDDRPWCTTLDPARPESPANPRRYPLGQCPLFFADAAAPLGGASTVFGLDEGLVTAGRVYAFRCTIVAGMTGNFFVTSSQGAD